MSLKRNEKEDLGKIRVSSSPAFSYTSAALRCVWKREAVQIIHRMCACEYVGRPRVAAEDDEDLFRVQNFEAEECRFTSASAVMKKVLETNAVVLR